MALKLRRARSKPVGSRCPECGEELGIDEELQPVHVICDWCVAIAIRDDRGSYRSLLTQEWLDFCLLSHFYDLLEERQRALDRLTSPEPARERHAGNGA